MTLFSSAPQMTGPRALIGVLWLSSWDSCGCIYLSPLLQIALYGGEWDWSAHTHVDFVLFSKLLFFFFFKGRFPFVFKHLKAFF